MQLSTCPGGYFITSNTKGSMPILGLKFYLNQYLGSVNYDMDKNSIFRVHKTEKRKNSGIWCGSPKIGLNIWGSQKVRLNI